mgnify:CR=1 FL=1
MSKYHRNANLSQASFLRSLWWPLFTLSVAILFLIYCPRLSQSNQINVNQHNDQYSENPDRTIAKLGPREIQLTTAESASLPTPSQIQTTSNIDDST